MGKIIKYDLSLTWIALNLAEWFPPIPKTPWVLVGKEYSSSHQSLIVNFWTIIQITLIIYLI